MLLAGCFSGHPLVNPLLVLDLGLHVLNCITRFNLESYSLACQRLHENLHSYEGIIYTENNFLSRNAIICVLKTT